MRACRAGICSVVMAFAVAALGAAGGNVPIVEAAKSGDAAAVAALVKQSADVNAAQVDGTTALHWAAHRDDLAVAAALIRAGARYQDISSTAAGRRARSIAAARGARQSMKPQMRASTS